MENTQEKQKPTLERLNETLFANVNELELLTEQIKILISKYHWQKDKLIS